MRLRVNSVVAQDWKYCFTTRGDRCELVRSAAMKNSSFGFEACPTCLRTTQGAVERLKVIELQISDAVHTAVKIDLSSPLYPLYVKITTAAYNKCNPGCRYSSPSFIHSSATKQLVSSDDTYSHSRSFSNEEICSSNGLETRTEHSNCGSLSELLDHLRIPL